MTTLSGLFDAAEADAHLPYYDGAVSWRAVDQAIVDAEEAALQTEKGLILFATRKIGKALFNHENRIRALEGKAAITKDQFIVALKAL